MSRAQLATIFGRGRLSVGGEGPGLLQAAVRNASGVRSADAPRLGPKIVDGMAYYSWSIDRTRAWLRDTIEERLAAFGIAPSAAQTLAAAAMDGALKPEVAALVQRLRAL
jgi:hypothetical protein